MTTVYSQNDSNIAVVKGDIKGIEKGIATISNEEMHVFLDSVEVKDGKFKLQITVNTARQYYVYIRNNEDENSGFLSNIFLGGGEEVMLNAELGVDLFPRISNAPLIDQSKAYEGYIKSQKESTELLKINSKISKALKDKDKVMVSELKKSRDTMSMTLIEKILKFKDNSTTSPVAAYQVYNYAYPLPIEYKSEIVQMFPENTSQLYYLDKLKSAIENEKKVETGNLAPNFNVQDLDGKEYTLDSFKGKYVFLEFSASWCGWCKVEIPFIREAYHKLGKKNIVFVTMNMDVTRELWKKTVKDDNIEWLCLSNLEGMYTELAASFNIRGIPMSYVIDPKGRIIKQGLRGDEVIKYLSSIL